MATPRTEGEAKPNCSSPSHPGCTCGYDLVHVARRRRISDEERLARELAPVVGRMLVDRTGRIALLVIVLVAALAAGGFYLYERYQQQNRNPPVVVQPSPPGTTPS